MATTTTESVAVLTVRRPAINLFAQGKQERIAFVFPWLLFIFAWLLLFPAHNELDAPLHPVDEQSSATLAQKAQDGSIVNRVVVVSLGIVGTFLLLRHRARIHQNSVMFGALFLFVAWNGLSMIWADDPALTLRRLIAFTLMVVFAAGCAVRMNATILTVFMALIPVLDLIPGVMAEVVYGKFSPLSGAYRFAGGSPHPNVEAAALSASCILVAWLVFRAKDKMRLRFAIILLVVTIFLILTGSRTSLLAVLASLSFSFFLVVARDYRKMLPFLLAALVLLVGVGGLVRLALSGGENDPFAHAIQRKGDGNDVSSLNGRIELWEQCLRFAAERPLTGYGYGGFWTAKRIEIVSATQEWPIQQSHSAYIEELLAIGVPGLTLYLVLLLGGLGVCVRLFFRRHDAYGAWAAVLVFITIHNATEAINVSPQFTSVAFQMIVLSLALADPSHVHSEKTDLNLQIT